MLDKNVINDSLARYNLADAAIQKMADEYLPLKIDGLDDKQGFDAVHSARMVVKNHRVQVEKTRRELKEDSLTYGRAVDAEAKRITALLNPIEDHLNSEESRITEMKAAIKREAEEKRQREIEEKEQKLREELERKRQEEEARLAALHEEREREERRLAAEREKIKEERRAEERRIAAERAEIEAERKRIEEERRAVEESNRRAEEEERHRKEIERARREAAERARRDAELAAQRKAEKERLEEILRKEEEARRLAEAPDKEKLQHAIIPLWPIKCERLETSSARNVLEEFEIELDHALEKIRRFIDG